MGFNYGYGGIEPSVSAVETTAPVAGTSAGLYTFTNAVPLAFAFAIPTTADLIYLLWNADADHVASATNYDAILEAGGQITSPGKQSDDYMVKTVGVWLPALATAAFLTDYQIRGLE